MTTCDYAESLNDQIKENNYNRLQTFFLEKTKLYEDLVKIIENDSSTNSQIEKAINDYKNYNYPGDSPTMNMKCCEPSINKNNDYFYNVKTQTCIVPTLLAGYKRYDGLSRANEDGFYDNIQYTSIPDAELKCNKICSDEPDKCKSFEISNTGTIQCKYYNDITNKYTIDKRSNMYIQTTETKKPFPLIAVLLSIFAILFIIIFIVLLIVYIKKRPSASKTMFGKRR
jgi:hypothetical protein